MNNAAKDASLSVYFQPGMSLPTWSILQTSSAPSSVQCQSRTSMMMIDDNQEEVSVDSGDNQPSADVGSVDLCEVWMIRSDCQRDTRQIIVPCGHQRFCGSCITKIEE